MALFCLCLVGCSAIIIVHNEGELPKIDIVPGKEFCDEDLDVKIRDDEIGVNCSKKISKSVR